MLISQLTKKRRARLAVSIALALVLNPASTPMLTASPLKPPKKPNILFFIMDDVGIDQMQAFGYGGVTPARTPNIDAIARAGVRFRNTWAMPECSPSRAMFFEGRYPLRTNVLAAIFSLDLANSQISPFETTTPRILKKKGYDNGLFGKFHLAGESNNPFGKAMPHALGWDAFYGFLEGVPDEIDTTAGGVAPIGTYSCGFVPGLGHPNGAAAGACYFADGSCRPQTSVGLIPAGLACLESGGILVPAQSCQASPPDTLNFTQASGYYVSSLVINHKDGAVEEVSLTDPRARGYRSTIEANAAINWVKQRPEHRPWMATVSFSSAHTPYQQPPRGLLSPTAVDSSGFNCTNFVESRILSDQMIEAMDSEIGRVLIELGLATRTAKGELDYHPEMTDTMVIIVGDNGSFGASVKAPFELTRSKGTVYQTGVWVPLIAAGPLVANPDRDVTHMVNIADLFALFGEIAGADVRKAVPEPHTLDSAPLLPYLTNPNQGSLRQSNFTQLADNITVNGARNPPCVIGAICITLTPTKQFCETQGGVWYGPGADPEHGGPNGVATCCEVKNQFDPNLDILPSAQEAMRNDRFKLVRQTVDNCTTGQADTILEFYELGESPLLPKLDRADEELLQQGPLSLEQQQNFDALSSELQTLLNSEVHCPGDGNLDKKVDGKDIQKWKFFRTLSQGQSSWYDLNFDGFTNDADRAIIEQYRGINCLKQP